jgi:hypothetical protein
VRNGCPGRFGCADFHNLSKRTFASNVGSWLDLAVSAMPPARPLHPQEATAKAAPTGTGLCGPMVRAVRLELTPPCGERLLRPSRLPIPPRPLTASSSSIRRLDREQHLWQPAHRLKVSAVSNPCPAAVEVGLGSTRAEPVVMRTAGIGANEPISAYLTNEQDCPEADVLRRRRLQQGHCRNRERALVPGPAISYRRHLAGVLGGNGLVPF